MYDMYMAGVISDIFCFIATKASQGRLGPQNQDICPRYWYLRHYRRLY